MQQDMIEGVRSPTQDGSAPEAGQTGIPLDEHVRADAGLPPSGGMFTCRPSSPFVGAWLR